MGLSACPDCNGTGKYIGFNEVEQCRSCKGMGQSRESNIQTTREISWDDVKRVAPHAYEKTVPRTRYNYFVLLETPLASGCKDLIMLIDGFTCVMVIVRAKQRWQHPRRQWAWNPRVEDWDEYDEEMTP